MTAPPHRARRLLVALLYVAGVLAFLEGTARLVLALPAGARLLANDDPSWRLRWVRRQDEKTKIYYPYDEWSPTRGWTLRAGLRGVPMGHGKTVSSNSRGVRGVREYAYERTPGVARIVVIGDSFTFGEDVDDHETFSHVLSELLPGTEVVNLGVHGYGHDQMLLYLREEGLRYRPDLVLLGFVYDDMERNVLRFRDYAKPRFVLEEGRLALRGTPVPPPERTLATEWRRSRFADLLSMLHARWRWKTGRTSDEMKDLTLALLDRVRAETEAIGARPAFAYLPVFGEVTRREMAMTGRERFFFSNMRGRGIQTMYLRPYFVRHMKDGAELKAYGHWGPLEHRIAAEGMRAYILDKGLLPPR